MQKLNRYHKSNPCWISTFHFQFVIPSALQIHCPKVAHSLPSQAHSNFALLLLLFHLTFRIPGALPSLLPITTPKFSIYTHLILLISLTISPVKPLLLKLKAFLSLNFFNWFPWIYLHVHYDKVHSYYWRIFLIKLIPIEKINITFLHKEYRTKFFTWSLSLSIILSHIFCQIFFQWCFCFLVSFHFFFSLSPLSIIQNPKQMPP